MNLERLAFDQPPARWMAATYALLKCPKFFQIGTQFGYLETTEVDSCLVTLGIISEIRYGTFFLRTRSNTRAVFAAANDLVIIKHAVK